MLKEVILIILMFLSGSSLAFILKGYTDAQVESIRILLSIFCTKLDENIKKELTEVSYICSNEKSVAFFIFVSFLTLTLLISVFESSNPLFLFLISIFSFLCGFSTMYFYFLY